MNKEVFLKQLGDKLYFLVDNEKNKEVEKYNALITNYVNMGQTEEDAIKSLGNFDDLVIAIYLSHGLDYKKIASGNTSAKGVKGAFKNFYNQISSKDRKTAFGALLYFLYVIILVILFRIIFIFIRDTGLTLFSDISSNRTLDRIYSLTFDVLYAVCAIILFIKMFTKKFGTK